MGNLKKIVEQALILSFIIPFLTADLLFAQGQPNSNKSKCDASLQQELSNLYDISKLPEYRSDTKMFQVSSYDRTGGNDDGFSGKYSYKWKNKKGELVIFDAKGSGVINRIWTPTPTNDTLDFYIDDTTRPAFSIRFRDLFSGKVFPFVSPLCGNELGGFYCYLPIPFQKQCKIVFRGKKLEFYQIQWRTYPEGTRVKNFDMHLDQGEKMALDKIASFWGKEKKSISDFTDKSADETLVKSESFDLKPGETKEIFELNKGGRILGIEIDPAQAFIGNNKQVDMQIYWDDEKNPAVDAPVADFFGYAFGSPSMQSLLLGSQGPTDYCYFPMPFDKKARIELNYRTIQGLENKGPIHLNTKIYYTREKRKAGSEGKFYAHWENKRLKASDGPYVFLDTKGKGQYVGTLLQAQGLNPGMTLFFEGDDSTAVDGEFTMHGTGSEDYFNGGWYALLDRWDSKMSLPIHGSMTYSLPMARTGGYRLFLSDKIPFEDHFFQSIEHGPTDNIPVDYTSVALYYSNSPVDTYIKPNNVLTKVYIPDTLMMYPQLMKFSIGGHVNFQFKGPLVLAGENGSLARIYLDEIPAGKYKLFIDFNKDEEGGEFSVWQRQVQLTDWISAYNKKREHIRQLYLGDIYIGDFKNTLTIRFRTDDGRKKLSLNRLIFVKDPD